MPIAFERLELSYGRHGATFNVASPLAHASGNGSVGANGGHMPGRPFIIFGPNGAGKTTLIEAPVRVLFGFKRVRREGREAHDRRRPWAGGSYRALVVLRTPAGSFTFERDFETDHVRVTRAGQKTPLFDGEANPSRSGESVQRYREILREVVGLTALEDYRRTACIFQGDLLGTDLGVDLLRVATGGHTDIESATRRLRTEYSLLTVQPIAAHASRRRKPGEVESLAAAIEELEAQVAQARETEARRTPLVRRRDECLVRIAGLDDDTERLEVAFESLSEAELLGTEVGASRARIRALESAGHDLDEALARFHLMTDQEDAHDAHYPRDFAERARVLEEGLWPRLSRIDREVAGLAVEPDAALLRVSPGLLFTVGGGLGLSGIGLVVSGRFVVGLLTVGLGVASAIAGLAFRRSLIVGASFREHRLSELAAERLQVSDQVDRLLEGLPDGDRLDGATLTAARREFVREEADRRLMEDGENALRGAMDAAARTLELHFAGRDEDSSTSINRSPGPPSPSPTSGGRAGLVDRARRWLDTLHDAAAAERDESLAPWQLRLSEIAKSRFDLPDDVEATLPAVGAARRARLESSARTRTELATIERELAGEGRVAASAFSLERELDELRDRSRAVEARAAAYRHAHAFVSDAYEAFRKTDEERLLSAISGHVSSLLGGVLGPLEAAGGLDGAMIRAGERLLPLASPPLSYGQLHATLLSVRLGAADFLAGLGVGLPLLIDDPFVHLDERSVTDLWDVLSAIATDRQVIVATQDRLVLDHLGVTPDLELEASGDPSALLAER